MKYWLGFLPLLALLLDGCASTVPASIRTNVAEPLRVAQAQADPKALMGHAVRWGGEILAVINHAKYSDVVVLRRPLFDNGEPKPEGGEARRFVARIPGFVDPAEFKTGQRLTVSGHLAGLVTIPVGQYPYPHPVVRVAEYHRWGKYVAPVVPPWVDDPFYCDPAWPWGYPGYRPYCW